jgi:uncharacterized protein YndB with AHSA1/START domain
MKRLLLLLMVVATPAYATSDVIHDGPVTVTKTSSRKSLEFEVLVPAPRESVWQAFTTREGLNSWLWKDCSVDLRPGGEWTVHFTETSTGGGTIEHIKAGREITIHAMAPEQFPTVRAVGTTAVFRFDAVGDTVTRVRLIQTGWKKGEEWAKAYEYLAKGNAQLLAQLRHRFTNGPIDWEAALRPAPAKTP